MISVPSGETAPAGVTRYLLPHESEVIAVRKHLAALLGPTGAEFFGLIAAIVLTARAGLSGEALLIMWLIWVLLAVYASGKIFAWTVNYFVVTSQRLLVTKGIITRDVAMMPLSQASGLRLRRTTIGRILGYGQFILPLTGQDPAMRKINYMPYPEQIYLEISGLIYPARKEPEPD